MHPRAFWGYMRCNKWLEIITPYQRHIFIGSTSTVRQWPFLEINLTFKNTCWVLNIFLEIFISSWKFMTWYFLVLEFHDVCYRIRKSTTFFWSCYFMINYVWTAVLKICFSTIRYFRNCFTPLVVEHFIVPTLLVLTSFQISDDCEQNHDSYCTYYMLFDQSVVFVSMATA